ncbi:unnamed protein product [Protopolystoma xenopodis]|uniref:Uncharacterized protein n=1 Tax=Protopolystoma xenopodis TaxID=117903 RepID=A0A3S5CED5_9PLAT|nr:unnamed protein product [Protopolystoma xenopodis]
MKLYIDPLHFATQLTRSVSPNSSSAYQLFETDRQASFFILDSQTHPNTFDPFLEPPINASLRKKEFDTDAILSQICIPIYPATSLNSFSTGDTFTNVQNGIPLDSVLSNTIEMHNPSVSCILTTTQTANNEISAITDMPICPIASSLSLLDFTTVASSTVLEMPIPMPTHTPSTSNCPLTLSSSSSCLFYPRPTIATHILKGSSDPKNSITSASWIRKESVLKASANSVDSPSTSHSVVDSIPSSRSPSVASLHISANQSTSTRVFPLTTFRRASTRRHCYNCLGFCLLLFSLFTFLLLLVCFASPGFLLPFSLYVCPFIPFGWWHCHGTHGQLPYTPILLDRIFPPPI